MLNKIIMGANLSSQYTRNTVTSLSSVVNNTVSNVFQDIETTCQSTNVYSAQYGSVATSVNTQTGEITFTPCPTTNISKLVVKQEAAGTCNVQGGITSSINETLTTTLSNKIKNWLTQNATQNNGFLGIGVNIAKEQGINETDLSDRISNTITSNIAQKCQASIAASNAAFVTYCGTYSDGIFVSQKAITTNLTSCIVNNMVSLIANDSVLNDIVTKTTQATDQANPGLSGILRYLIIAAIILGALIVIGIVLYLIFGNKSNLPAALQRYPSGGNQINPLEREEIEECLGPARRRLEERGIPLTKEALRPDVERCLVEKRAERREGVARIEREARFEGEGSRERFSEPRVAEETGRERFENRARYGVPNESVSTLV